MVSPPLRKFSSVLVARKTTSNMVRSEEPVGSHLGRGEVGSCQEQGPVVEASVKAYKNSPHTRVEEGGRRQPGVTDGLQEERRGNLLGGHSLYLRLASFHTKGRLHCSNVARVLTFAVERGGEVSANP